MSKLIKAVTFDLWETLLFERNGDSSRRSSARCNGLAKAFGILGITVSAEQVNGAMGQTIERLLEIWDRNADVSHVEQLELLVRYVSDGSLTLESKWVQELSTAYIHPFFEIPPYLNPFAESVLRRLTESGKKIGLICNTGLTPGFALKELLDSEGVLEYFDFLAFSDEIGFRKPDPRIFHLVSRKLKADPSAIVHVGDNLRIDACGAKNAGFKAIYFECDAGRDKVAEADSGSLVSRSRNIGRLKKAEMVPDKKINSFDKVDEAIHQLEAETHVCQ